MKDTPVSDDFKIVQIFLPSRIGTSPEIYEVSSNEKEFRCTCPSYNSRKACKHLSFVKARIEASGGGTYPLEVSYKATVEEAKQAQRSPESFREFIIKYGRVEVL